MILATALWLWQLGSSKGSSLSSCIQCSPGRFSAATSATSIETWLGLQGRPSVSKSVGSIIGATLWYKTVCRIVIYCIWYVYVIIYKSYFLHYFSMNCKLLLWYSRASHSWGDSLGLVSGSCTRAITTVTIAYRLSLVNVGEAQTCIHEPLAWGDGKPSLNEAQMVQLSFVESDLAVLPKSESLLTELWHSELNVVASFLSHWKFAIWMGTLQNFLEWLMGIYCNSVIYSKLLLMEEIPNNHLGCMKPSTYYGINYQPQLVSRISSINSIPHQLYF